MQKLMLCNVFVLSISIFSYNCSGEGSQIDGQTFISCQHEPLDLIGGYGGEGSNESHHYPNNDEGISSLTLRSYISYSEGSGTAALILSDVLSKSNKNSEVIPQRRFCARIVIECRFSDVYLQDYDNNNSMAYKLYTDNVARKMMTEFDKGPLKLNRIQFISLRPGSVQATIVVDASSNTSIANSTQLQSTVTGTMNSAFNDSVNVTGVNVATSASGGVSSPNSATKSSSFVTGAAPQLGEYLILINVVCKFSDVYINDYNNSNSQAYQNYTNNIKIAYGASPALQSVMRLRDIVFYSLSNGSVVANMQLNVASTSSDANVIGSAITTATNKVFPNAIITSYQVTYNSLNIESQSPLSTSTPKLEEWAISLMAIAALMLVLGVIVVVTAITIRVRSKDKELTKFMHVHDPASQGCLNEGMIHDTWVDRSKSEVYEVKT